MAACGDLDRRVIDVPWISRPDRSTMDREWNLSAGLPYCSPLRIVSGYIDDVPCPENICLRVAGIDGNSRRTRVSRAEGALVGRRGIAGLALGLGVSQIVAKDSFAATNSQDLESLAKSLAQKSDFIHLYDYLSPAQISDYEARTAQTNYAAALDLSSEIQTAIYESYSAGRNLYCPAGAAKIVTGLEIPMKMDRYEDRGDAWQMVGQGASHTFVRSGYKGTVFITKTDAPVFRYHQRRPGPSPGANWRVHGFRFMQMNPLAESPVIQIDSLCEHAEFAWNQVYQAGNGDGIRVEYQIKGSIHHNFIMNRDWLAGSASAVGVGINVPSGKGSGLLTIKKNSCRGFLWALVVGDGTHDPSASLLEQNEASMCQNGTWIRKGVSTCEIHKNYYEGIAGVCILDEAQGTEIHGCHMYLGFSIGIDGSFSSNYGSNYHDNYLETNGSQPCVLIKIASGGPKKSVRDNRLLFSKSGGAIPGIVGLQLSGATARIDHCNVFNPRGQWIGGSGTRKIDDTTVNGVFGFGTGVDADLEYPYLSRGAMSLAKGAILTERDVGASVLACGSASYYEVAATTRVLVQELSVANFRHGQRILFRTSNGNMVFSTGPQMKLANGASFVGPGVIEFICELSGAKTTAYEIGRTVF